MSTCCSPTHSIMYCTRVYTQSTRDKREAKKNNTRYLSKTPHAHTTRSLPDSDISTQQNRGLKHVKSHTASRITSSCCCTSSILVSQPGTQLLQMLCINNIKSCRVIGVDIQHSQQPATLRSDATTTLGVCLLLLLLLLCFPWMLLVCCCWCWLCC